MKKFFITFIFLFLSLSNSLAKNNEKITINEIHALLLNNSNFRALIERKKNEWRKLREYETEKKRIETRGIAKCMYEKPSLECHAKIIQRVFKRKEQGKKRRPGDIFYGLEALEKLIYDYKNLSKLVQSGYVYKDDSGKLRYYGTKTEVEKDAVCLNMKPEWRTWTEDYEHICQYFTPYTLKKLAKFKKDPSKEKYLGKDIIKHIKNVRVINSIKEKIGDDRYALLGDMLNSTIVDVKKNKLPPNLKLRKYLLKKYSLKLGDIKQNLDDDKYKSIEKDVLNLSKTFEKLNTLKSSDNIMDENIDKAVNIISDTNKLIKNVSLKAKENKEQKSLAISLIYFMDSFVDSILNSIPGKYHAVTQKLNLNLFNEHDLNQLDSMVDAIIKRNNEFKSSELVKNINITSSYIDPSDIFKKLNELGMKNSLEQVFDQNKAVEIANQQIEDNLDKAIFKDIKKIVQKINKDELSDISKEISVVSKEISKVSSEISSSSSVKTTVTSSYPDPKFGGQSLKRLIAISRRQ